MELRTFTGIIVNTTNYSESSKILKIYTKEEGVLSVLAKGCRGMKSPLRSVCNRLVYATFHVSYKEDKLSTLMDVDVINPFFHILSDLTCVSLATFLLDLVNQVVRESDDARIFTLFMATLTKMEEGLSPYALSLILQLQLLEYLGVKPLLDGCASCGSKQVVTLDSHSGGYLCSNCYTNERLVSPKTIKIIKMFQEVDVSKLAKLDVKEDILKEISIFLDDYYDQFTGLYVKSKKFLKEIEKIGGSV